MTDKADDRSSGGFGIGWWVGLALVLIAALLIIGQMSLSDARERRYVEAGLEKANDLNEKRLDAAAAIQDPIVRLQSWAYVNSLRECMLMRTGVFSRSRVSIRMIVLAREQPLRGVNGPSVEEAVESVEQLCNEGLLAEIAITNPTGALALAAELKEQGLYLPEMVTANAIKNRDALVHMRPLSLAGK